MINLINGRGQIGECLQQYVKLKEYENVDIDIYHTWIFTSKEEDIQKEEYEKLKRYVKNNTNKPFIFVSTSVVNYNFYYHYKLLSETYILNNTHNGYIIRLPNLIGKGICTRFKNERVDPFGTIELLTIEEATKQIIESISNFNINNRVENVLGTKIPATIVYKLLNFGD